MWSSRFISGSPRIALPEKSEGDRAVSCAKPCGDVGIPARPALALPAVGQQRRFPGPRARPCDLCRAALPAARRRCPVPRAWWRAWAWAWAWRARARSGSDGAGTTGDQREHRRLRRGPCARRHAWRERRTRAPTPQCPEAQKHPSRTVMSGCAVRRTERPLFPARRSWA